MTNQKGKYGIREFWKSTLARFYTTENQKMRFNPPPKWFLFIILYNKSIQGKLNISFTLNSIGDKIRVGEISVTKDFQWLDTDIAHFYSIKQYNLSVKFLIQSISINEICNILKVSQRTGHTLLVWHSCFWRPVQRDRWTA